MIGVALVGFITILASSTKASTAAGRRHARSGPTTSSTPGPGATAGSAPRSRTTWRALPEVEAALPAALRSRPTVDGGTGERDRVRHRGHRGPHGPRRHRRRHRRRPRRRPRRSPPTGPTELGVGLGDTVTVGFSATGDVELTVRALFDERPPRRRRHGPRRRPRHLRGQRHRPVRPAGVRDDRTTASTPPRPAAAIERRARGSGRTPSCRTRPASRRRSPRRST